MNAKYGAGVFLALVAFVWLGLAVPTKSIAFHGLDQAKNQLEEAGFYCISDRADGKVQMGGFLVSRDRLSWPAANSIRKIGTMGPEWRQMAWVTAGDADLGTLFSAPDDADVRTWGNVYVMGERVFLDEIEQALVSVEK